MAGRRPKPIYMFDCEGQLVNQFTDIHAAAASVGLRISAMYEVIGKSRLYDGYVYSFNTTFTGKVKRPVVASTAPAHPWEKNGYFDIDGWAKQFPEERNFKL